MSGRCVRPGSRRVTLAALAPIFVLALLLAACGGGAAAPVGGDLVAAESAASAPRALSDAGAVDGEADGSYADIVDRQIIKTGEITIQVSAVATAIGTVRAMALEMGGYVGGSNAGGPEDAATLTLRIPADRFDDTVARLHELDGKVMAEATREEDVTGQVVDLDARIRNLQASEAQYRALLQQATKIDDILTVQSRLDNVRGEIEQLQAQLDRLSKLAALSTITVTLVPDEAPISSTAEGWDAGAILESAVAALVGLGQGLAAVAIWLVILGLPLAVLTGVVVLLGLRIAPAMRRRRAGSTD